MSSVYDYEILNCFIHTNLIQPLDDGEAIGNNQCLCLPKTELNTKNSKKHKFSHRIVVFFVFNPGQQFMGVPSEGINSVGHGGHFAVLCLYLSAICV